MNIKKLTALILAAVILISLSACRKRPEDTTTKAPNDVTQSYNEITSSAPAEEPSTLTPLEFDENEAQEIGTFDTEIFGTLSVYYQEDRLILFDSYSAKRFELYAFSYLPNYEDAPAQIIGEDVNFDGYTDFYLLYSKGNLNTYYCFWIWNMEERTYEYYLPLSSVPSPVFNAGTKRIISSDQISIDTIITTEYIWNNGEIVPVANSETKIDISDTSEVDTPYDMDASVVVLDGTLLSTVIMSEDTSSSNKWLCNIEDEGIVKLSSNRLDKASGSRTFIFRGISPGTTTVVMSYAESSNAPYLMQRILNITVNDNYTLKIVVVE